MASWGWMLVALSAASALLPRFGMQLLFLAWVDRWGEGPGWAIRGAIVVVGVAMIVVARVRRRPKGSAPK